MRFFILAIAVMGYALTAHAQDSAFPPSASAAPEDPAVAAKLEREKGKVIGLIKGDPRLSTFAELLTTAKLDEDLANPPPSQKERYSVFAPSDEAFLKIPKSTLDDLLKPENADRLKNILNYHIIVGKFTILPYPQNITAQNGQRISVSASVKGSTYGTAMIEGEPVQASNGVVYIIDTVQFPDRKK